MYAVTICTPPLGATTVVEADGKPVRFTVVLELAKQSPNTQKLDENLAVELWYGLEGDPVWREARFRSAETSTLSVLNPEPEPYRQQKQFHLDLEYSELKPLNYTIRFRTSSTSPWLWAANYGASNDGRLLFRSPQCTLQTLAFSSLFHNIPSSVTVNESSSQVSGVTIYNVTAPISANSTAHVSLGNPVNMEKYYALVKLSSPWFGPRHGGNSMSLDKDGVLAGFLRSDGQNVVILGLAAVDAATTYIRTGSGGSVELKTRNDGTGEAIHRAIVAVGPEWQRTLNAAFYRARELIRGFSVTDVPQEEKEDGIVNVQWKKEWYDGLAYCTWNGLGREITEQRILDSLQDLVNNGIKVSALIIDDNWQSLISRKWDKFEADPKQFPRGLKATVTTIKERFPHITHVAVWHAIFGYWDGVAPGGWIDKNYKCETLKWHGGWDVRVIAADDVGRCYDEFYGFLSDCGVDGVKTDVQASLDELDNGADRQRISRAYQDAFKLASMKHFSRQVIYCMAMQPFILLHSLLSPTSGQPPVLRNSDDFFPNIASSHPWHIFANAMNNLYTSNLNALPDWDMFQSSLPTYGSMHAAARCISGGPIYITDSPGKHDVALLKHMSAATPQGGGLISLRPSRVANVTNPYVPYQGSQLLRIANFVGSKGGTALLAVFNTATSPVSEVLQLKDFPGIEPQKRYVVRAFTADTVVDLGKLEDTEANSISLALQPYGWEFFTAISITDAFSSTGEEYQIGTLGLVDKIAGAAALVEQTVILPTRGGAGIRTKVVVKVKALGVLGFYVSNLPSREISRLFITVNGTPVAEETVSKGGSHGTLLLFDLEKAWESLDLQAPWSGELVVQLLLD